MKILHGSSYRPYLKHFQYESPTLGSAKEILANVKKLHCVGVFSG